MSRFFLTLLLLFFSKTLAQEYNFKTYTTDEGLSNNSVLDIENAKSGALWIATWDGLNYFDGNTFTVFKHIANDNSSIAGNEIYQLVKDRENQIWIRTNKSISTYIGKGKFKNYTFSKRIRELHLSKNKIPIVSFLDDSYVIFKNDTFIASKKESIYRKNNMLVFKNLLLSKKPKLIINDVYKDDDNILFATRNNGLFVLKTLKNNFEIINYKKDLYSRFSIGSNEIEKIHTDVFGGIWLGFKDGGLSLIQKTTSGITTIVPHPKDFPHLPTETIRAIVKDGKNRLWLGYYTKGLYYFSEQTNYFLPFKIPKSEENADWNRIRSLYKTSDNALWVGTYAGIIRIYKDKLSYYSAEDYKLFPNNRTYSFFEKDDKLWVSCWGGVAKINLETLQFEDFKEQEKLNTFHIRKIYAYKNYLLLATKNNGIIQFNHTTGSLRNITEKEGLSGNSVFSIFHDKERRKFWISSLGGITIFNEKFEVIKTLTESEGLPSHMVYGLLDNENLVWASTTKGIAKIGKKEFLVNSMSFNEDWQAKEFSEGAHFKDTNGVLYFAGVKGLSFFLPEQLKINANLPILKVNVEGANEKLEVVKKSTDNFLKIKITPISYVNNANNKVLYRLQGYDKDWKIFNRQQILYEKLPAGNFVFEVKNSLDFSAKKEITYKVIIKKPFYLSSWFLGLLLICCMSLVLYYVYRRNKLSKEYKRTLELEIEKRTQTINNQKTELLKLHNSIKNNEFEIDKFKTFVIKKFKQPLTIILENVSSSLIQPEKKEVIIEETKGLINKVIKWNYLENITNLGSFKKVLISFETIKLSFLQYKQHFTDVGIDYKVITTNELNFIEIDLVRYKLLIQYLLNDIIKFDKKNTQLRVELNSENKKIVIKLMSNNTILKDNIEYIQKFSPYYKAFLQILEDLEGQATINNNLENLLITIKLPIQKESIEIKKEVEETLNSISLNAIDLPDDKTIFLVHGSKEDFNVASCILESSENYLVFESDENNVHKLIHKTKRFNALILYNVSFSNKLVNLLNSIHKNNSIPTIYISEEIDYSLQEKITTFNINEIIQLPASKKLVTNKIEKVLHNFLEKSKQETVKPKATSPNEKLVNKALKVIKKNYGNTNFNVDYLVNELAISRVKCYRMFKEVLNQSPLDVIVQYRMQIATELINTTSLNISEISLECGFNDPKYFSKVFKKYYGINPKNYKNK